ncbi:unnamed protein product [Ilex paraguariensis]|uniref:Uncharacterized protein n=1 Tax=Ilex paraguariensis TaxID=185542 RepID=A0ABC8UVP9_9AQUA
MGWLGTGTVDVANISLHANVGELIGRDLGRVTLATSDIGVLGKDAKIVGGGTINRYEAGVPHVVGNTEEAWVEDVHGATGGSLHEESGKVLGGVGKPEVGRLANGTPGDGDKGHGDAYELLGSDIGGEILLRQHSRLANRALYYDRQICARADDDVLANDSGRLRSSE